MFTARSLDPSLCTPCLFKRVLCSSLHTSLGRCPSHPSVTGAIYSSYHFQKPPLGLCCPLHLTLPPQLCSRCQAPHMNAHVSQDPSSPKRSLLSRRHWLPCAPQMSQPALNDSRLRLMRAELTKQITTSASQFFGNFLVGWVYKVNRVGDSGYPTKYHSYI